MERRSVSPFDRDVSLVSHRDIGSLLMEEWHLTNAALGMGGRGSFFSVSPGYHMTKLCEYLGRHLGMKLVKRGRV